MKRLALGLVALLTLGLAPEARAAAELITFPLFPADGDVLECSILNASTKIRTVRIRIFDLFGEMVADSGDKALTAGRTERLTVLGQSLFGDGHCRFTVEGSKKLYRAVGKVRSATATVSDYAAVPAQ